MFIFIYIYIYIVIYNANLSLYVKAYQLCTLKTFGQL